MSKIIVTKDPVQPPRGYVPVVPEQYYDNGMTHVFILDPETAYLRMGRCSCIAKTWLDKFIKYHPEADIIITTRPGSELVPWFQEKHPDWDVEVRTR